MKVENALGLLVDASRVSSPLRDAVAVIEAELRRLRDMEDRPVSDLVQQLRSARTEECLQCSTYVPCKHDTTGCDCWCHKPAELMEAAAARIELLESARPGDCSFCEEPLSEHTAAELAGCRADTVFGGAS